MFSVYGSSGRLFRGTLEQLRQIGPVHAVDRTRVIEAVVHDGRDGALREVSESQPSIGGESQRGALAAYSKAAQPERQRWSETRVGAVMNRDLVSVNHTATVRQAWQQLDRHGIGQAPVVNASATLVGLVTRAVLARFDQLPGADGEGGSWRALLGQSVQAIMLTPVPSVAAETDLRRVATLLLESGLPGLPVVDDAGLVIGFVSRSDVLRAALADAAVNVWG